MGCLQPLSHWLTIVRFSLYMSQNWHLQLVHLSNRMQHFDTQQLQNNCFEALFQQRQSNSTLIANRWRTNLDTPPGRGLKWCCPVPRCSERMVRVAGHTVSVRRPSAGCSKPTGCRPEPAVLRTASPHPTTYSTGCLWWSHHAAFCDITSQVSYIAIGFRLFYRQLYIYIYIQWL